MAEKCPDCGKSLDSPLRLYAHLVEKHGYEEEDARKAAWPKGALL